jgi:hypothetical protein
VKQLVDLNGSSVNFDVNFTVSSKDKKPFQVLVVDQTTLDNNPSLEYKMVVEGQISGNVRNDKNVYQNHFLVLRSDTPCECDVEIIKMELPKMAQPPIEQLVQLKPDTDWKRITLVAIAVILGGYVLYTFFYKKDVKVEIPKFTFMSPVPSPLASRSASRSTSLDISLDVSPLAARLKNLNIN